MSILKININLTSICASVNMISLIPVSMMTGRESAASSGGETPRAVDARAPIIEPLSRLYKNIIYKQN